MRHLKTAMIVVASLVLPVLLGLAGCGDDHRDHFRGDRGRSPERYERRDGDRHDGPGGGSGPDRSERGDR